MAVIVALERWETIPFHFIWVSLTIVYGFRVWSVRSTLVVLVGVMAVTGGALLVAVTSAHESLDELAEVPLMAAMFVAMVWHARRRQTAVEDAQRLAESEHRMLEAQRGFVRDASHVLRTPITVARGHAELIRSSVEDPQVREDAEVVVDELERMARLSEELLLLTAAEHPGFLRTRSLRVDLLLQDLLRRWRPAADRHWRVEVDGERWVVADPERLASALDALIENAVHATEPGDLIRLGARTEGGSLVLEVADTGPGIPPAELPRIFERFSRPEANGRGRGGTGLGLAIVKAIVEAHGGTVGVRSRTGAGTVFTISLPDARLSASAGAVEREHPTPPDGVSGQQPLSSGSSGRKSSE
ncbi:MAG: sensor histidine kinase [Candidatus Velamenicoccus archaeovorus]